jgi:hypothetical protein
MYLVCRKRIRLMVRRMRLPSKNSSVTIASSREADEIKMMTVGSKGKFNMVAIPLFSRFALDFPPKADRPLADGFSYFGF